MDHIFLPEALQAQLADIDFISIVQKGFHADVDSYSGFWDNERRYKTELDDILKRNKIDTLFTGRLSFQFKPGRIDMKKALIVVDVQYDFLPTSGALAVPGGDEVNIRESLSLFAT